MAHGCSDQTDVTIKIAIPKVIVTSVFYCTSIVQSENGSFPLVKKISQMNVGNCGEGSTEATQSTGASHFNLNLTLLATIVLAPVTSILILLY